MHSQTPANGPLEVVFSFDATVSMRECCDEVKARLQDLVQRLQSDIPGIKIAIFAHGDYDSESGWITKCIDFSTDVAKLCQFVQSVEENPGYTPPECYELVLRKVRTELSWTPGSRRCLVLFGDEVPHEAGFPDNKDNIDWRDETFQLATRGVTIYGVQCKNNLHARTFYETISSASGGKYLRLEDSGNLFDLIMAVCYKESNDTAMLSAYAEEVRAREGDLGVSSDIKAVFDALSDGATASPSESAKLHTAPKGKVASPSTTSLLMAGARKTPIPTPSGSGRLGKRRSKRFSPYHKERLPLLKRENVYEKNFVLSRLNWSPWILVLSPEKPDGHETVWEKRQGGDHTGFRLNMISHKDKGVQGTNGHYKILFEVAVQTPDSRRKRHVVYCSSATCCLNDPSWERCLYGVRHQLERVLRNGCQVHLRYSVTGTHTDSMPSLKRDLERYDYAWKQIYQIRNDARDVMKGTFPVSMSGRN